jgi:hypothetical protein
MASDFESHKATLDALTKRRDQHWQRQKCYSTLHSKLFHGNSRRRVFARNVEILLIYFQVVHCSFVQACSFEWHYTYTAKDNSKPQSTRYKNRWAVLEQELQSSGRIRKVMFEIEELSCSINILFIYFIANAVYNYFFICMEKLNKRPSKVLFIICLTSFFSASFNCWSRFD